MSEKDVSRSRGRPRGSDGSALLDIARDEFLAQGYARTTMDAIAARGRISKQSLYGRYSSKERLFAAVVSDWVDRGADSMRPHTDALVASADVSRALLRLTQTLQAAILSTPVLQMRTLVAAEAARFPDVARDYVSRSWDRNLRTLAEALAVLAERGDLRTDDPALAAEQLTWLALAAPLNRLTLQAGADPYSDADLNDIAREAVRTFLDRFGA